jgi:hypothetical protein
MTLVLTHLRPRKKIYDVLKAIRKGIRCSSCNLSSVGHMHAGYRQINLTKHWNVVGGQDGSVETFPLKLR